MLVQISLLVFIILLFILLHGQQRIITIILNSNVFAKVILRTPEDVKTEELNKEVDANPDLFKVKKAIEFMTKVASGEVKVEKVDTDKDGSPI